MRHYLRCARVNGTFACVAGGEAFALVAGRFAPDFLARHMRIANMISVAAA